MRNPRMLSGIVAALLSLSMGAAWAKLPPPTEEEKAKAEATKKKAAEDAAVEKQKLEKAQDRIVQKYKEGKSDAGSKTASASATDSRTEIPSAAINSRPLEKAHAYNEGVTPQSASGASDGSKTQAAGVPQEKSK